MILLGIVTAAFILLMIPISAYAQLPTASDFNKTTEAKKYMDKLHLMLQSCILRVQSGDIETTQICLDVVQKFNTHMQQLFNETRNEMIKILLD